MSQSALAVGEEAPAFVAPLARPTGETEVVPFASLLEERPVLLVFYTNDFTPNCVAEWCSFRDYSYLATEDRYQVVGISKSWTATHHRFIDWLDLPFPLYSDTNLDVAEAFGVDYRTFGLLRRSWRSCFLVDTDRTVRYRWLADHPLDPTRDVPDVWEVHEGVVEALGGAAPSPAPDV
jgi:peroxiredoxin Q/BCP